MPVTRWTQLSSYGAIMHFDPFDPAADGADALCYIADRATLDTAVSLIAEFGDAAILQAALRADASRNKGNVIGFCRWRQIERVIATLGDHSGGTLH